MFSRFSGGSSAFSVDAGGYDLRSVTQSGITQVRVQIQDYVNGINEILQQINKVTVDQVATALRGKAQCATVTNYVNATVTEIQKVTSLFSQFDEALQKVYANYAAQASAVTTSDVVDANTQVGHSESDNLSGVAGFGE